MKKSLYIRNRNINIYYSDEYTNNTSIFYMVSSALKNDDDIYELVRDQNINLVTIESLDWNNELSPWPSEKVFSVGDDFKGMADKLLKTIKTDIITEVEKTLNITFNYRVLIGYSLAGLFALWAGYQTDIFHSLGSISGSLWFDGFLDYIKSSTFCYSVNKIYLSLGDKESKTKNPVISKVKDYTIQIENHLKKSNIQTLLEINPGNHFNDANIRIARAILYLKYCYDDEMYTSEICSLQ